MKAKTFLALLFLGALSSACPSGVDPANPYDPDTPIDSKAKASLSGQVLLEGSGDVTQVEILVAGLTGHPQQDGSFLMEGIAPTIQEALFRLEGYEDVRQSRLFSPGATEEMNVRIQVLRGSVTGNVLLQEQNDHSGVTVVLVPANNPEGSFQMAALTATQGNYVFDSVPVGTYKLSASKPHYMGKVVNDIKVDPYSISQVPQLELPPVTGAVEILGGDPDQPDPYVNPDYPACCPNDRFTRTSQVLLHTEGFNAVRMKVSEDQATLQGSEGWETYETEQTFDLSELNGAKTVYVLLEDNSGVRSDVLEGHTILDTQAPEVIDLALGDGSGYTAESAISVSAFGDDLPMESGLAEMRMEVGSAPAQDAVWQPYLLRAPLVLPQQDGEHQVFVELRDRAGNRAPVVSGAIRLDRQPPHPAQGMQPVVVHNGSGYALGMDVPIYFNVTDDVSPTEDMKMAVCETEGCDGVAFSPYSSQTIMSFSSEGMHTVYAVFKDGAGNVYSPEGVSFEIDTTAPTFPVVSVEEGPSVSSPDIHLLIDLSGADQVLVSENAEVPAIDDGRWSDFQNRLAYNIGQAEGEHMIFVYAKDMAGHMTGPAMVRVELDTTPPDGTLHIVTKQSNCNGTQCYTNSESVLVEVGISSADDTSSIQMQLSLDDTFDEALQAYSPVATVLLAGDQSIFQQVHAQLIDLAGNTTQIVSDNEIRLDLDPPSLPLISTTPLGYTSSHQGITLSIDTDSQDDVSGVDRYEYLIDPLPLNWGSLTWKVFSGSTETVDVDACDSCTYTFMVRAIDFAGNIGDPASVRLVVDENAPEMPHASVLASEIDKGPKVINADAVSVWVQSEDSSDENFDQFQVRLRTCSGGFDPETSMCGSGWNSWSSWRDTGVGKGGREILVVLAAQNTANQIEVRGLDLTGATSPADSVIFTEDSRPPSPPTMYPDSAVVNADTAILYISHLAQDENAIDSYECTINGKFECLSWAKIQENPDIWDWSDNGGNSASLPGDKTTELKVHLDQDSENIVRIRAIDKAGNYSGSFESSITEKSTIYDAPKQINARSANRLIDTTYNFTLTNLDSMDMDASLMATAFYGRMDDNSDIGGILIQDLNSNVNMVFNSGVSDVHVEHQQIVATVSLFNICNGDFGTVDQMYDSTNNVEFPNLCNCVMGSDCSPFSSSVQNLLTNHRDEVGIPILIDMSTGEPILQVIYTDSDAGLGVHTPLLYENNYYNSLTSFDGMRFAWLGSPAYPDTINVSRMDNKNGLPCNPSQEFCVFTIIGSKALIQSGKSGQVAVTDKIVAWKQIDRTQTSHIYVYDYVNDGGPWDIDPEGAKFDRDLVDPMVADCHWSEETNGPICRHLFWVDQSSLSPSVKVLDLENPGALITDELRHGIIEIHSMSAEDGKVAWLDLIDGTADVFFMDLDDPQQCDPSPGSRNCEGHEKIIVRSDEEETMLAMSGPLATYWRLAGDGLQLHMSDVGSRPWFLARPGLHAITKTDNDKVLLSSIDPWASSNPYKVGVFDAATHELSWKDEGESMHIPVAIRDLGNGEEAISFLSINDISGNFETLYFDPSLGNSISLHKTAAQMGINIDPTSAFITTSATGDRNRTIWVEQEVHSNGTKGYIAILDCDMDQLGPEPCQLGNFRLLYKIPDIWSEYPSVCSVATNGDIGVLVLVKDPDIEVEAHPSSAYRVDMAALDSYNALPIVPTSIHTLATDFPTIHSELFGGSDLSTRFEQNQCSDFMENRAVIDPSSQSSTIAIAVSSNTCTRCTQDNDTTYFNEFCDAPPCCGNQECDCTSPASNTCDDVYTGNMNNLLICDSNNNCHTVSSLIDDESSTSLKLLNDFFAWRTHQDGKWVLLVKDLLTGSTWKLFKDNKDVMFPHLYQKNGATHLMWTDASLGPMQIFSTVLSH